MSRIILTKYNDGEEHIVVGWDRASQTFYWQEFSQNQEEELLAYGGDTHYAELPEIQDLFDDALVKNANVSDAIVDAIDSGALLPLLREHALLPFPASNAIVDLSTRE